MTSVCVSEDVWLAADPMLARMAKLRAKDPRRVELRDQVICQCAQEACREAGRYRNTGEPFDDLVQVATLGLILAVDRYDPRRGIPFKHFALPTIVGELKRHFRDKGWGIKVTRRVQRLYQEVRRAEPLLAQRLSRTRLRAIWPLAERLGLPGPVRRGHRGGPGWRRRVHDPVAELRHVWRGRGRRGGARRQLDRDLEAVADHDALVGAGDEVLGRRSGRRRGCRRPAVRRGARPGRAAACP